MPEKLRVRTLPLRTQISPCSEEGIMRVPESLQSSHVSWPTLDMAALEG